MNAGGDNIILLVIIGIIVMLLFIVSFLLVFLVSQRKKNQYQLAMQNLKGEQQNMLIEAAVKSEEMERHRIASELHDEVGALLSATKLHFNAIDTGAMDAGDVKTHTRAKELLDDSIQQIRSISHNLHSIILKEMGLHEGIKNFVRKIASNSVIKATTNFDKNYISKSTELDMSIYRIVQELMNNTIKHANASVLQIASYALPDKFVLVFEHNGNGLSQLEFEELRYKPDGLGLKNIQNRIILLKGSILFDKKPDVSSIKIEIPQHSGINV